MKFNVSHIISRALPQENQNRMDIRNENDFKAIFGMNSTEKFISICLMVVGTIYFNIVNILLFKKRKNYVIKHRGIVLTLPSAVAGYFIIMNMLLNEIVYTMEFHNFYIYINNILIVFVIMSACGRTIRLILLYNLNAFKSECILQIQDFSAQSIKDKPPKVEVNSYMKTVNNIVKKKTGKWLLIVSIALTFVITVIMEIVKNNQKTNFTVVKIAEFAPINLFLTIIILISAYFMYCLRNIKDNETLGIKFEVYTSTIFSVFVFILSFLMYRPSSLVPYIVEHSHSGAYIYIAQTWLGHFNSATIPLILSYIEEKKFKKQSKILSSAEFSKLLYRKSVIDDLKVIAINDFCVENILFWETYIKIKELTYQCLTNTGIFEDKNKAIKEEDVYGMNKGLTGLYSNSRHNRKYIDKKEFGLKKSKNKNLYQHSYEHHIRHDPFYSRTLSNDNSYSKNDTNHSNDDESFFYTPRVTSPTKQYNKNYFTPDDYKDYDIDPNIPLDSRLMPYYISFYKAFIDPDGPVNVSISSDIAATIYKNLFNNPTVGVFDEAKNDVITSMFLTLYPQFINLHFNR